MSGTKRVRIPRTSAPGLISPQAVALYRRALDLRRRGADHETVHAAEADVDRLLGGGVRRLWLTSVFDIHRWPPKPDDLEGQRTLEHRRQLDAALSGLQRQEREARRQARAARRAAKGASPAPERETEPV
jgi:hypothetical protein